MCQDDNWNNPAYIDTLAAAYAEMDRWEEAVETQRKAIDKLTDEDAYMRVEFESHLQMYLKREKVRE